LSRFKISNAVCSFCTLIAFCEEYFGNLVWNDQFAVSSYDFPAGNLFWFPYSQLPHPLIIYWMVLFGNPSKDSFLRSKFSFIAIYNNPIL
jgi:hypothetical protein